MEKNKEKESSLNKEQNKPIGVQKNKTNKQMLDNFGLANSIVEILQENEDTFIKKDNRIIISNKIVYKILTLFHKKKIDKEFRNFIKAILKKFFALNFKSAILFKNDNIYIIKARLDIKRFNGFSKEDIEFALNEIIESEYSINDIINKSIRKLKIKDYSRNELKEFIEGSYKTKILETITEVLINITNENIDKNIIKGVAGKIFRDNYDTILEKVTYNILSHLIDINKAINNSIDNLVKSKFNLENEGNNFLELNKKLERFILKELSNEIELQLTKEVKTGINEDILKRTIRNLILKRAIVVFSEKFSKYLIEIIKTNHTKQKIIKNIDSFLSYYSGKTEIIGNIKFIYPKISITNTKDIIHEINYNHKLIINKILEYIRDKIRKENELEKEKTRKEQSIKTNEKLSEKINQKKQEVIELENKLEKLEKELKDNQILIKKLEKELDENKKSIINNTIKSIGPNSPTKRIEKIKKTIEQIQIEISSTKLRKKFIEGQLKDLENKKIDIKKIDKRISFIEEQIEKINNILNNFQLDLRDTFKQRKKVVN